MTRKDEVKLLVNKLCNFICMSMFDIKALDVSGYCVWSSPDINSASF